MGDSVVSAVEAELPELDGYDLIEEIGRGGMGVVYEAYQRSTGRRVAVKFMLESAAANEGARHRFEREVELVARLQHPHIVPVLDSGAQRGHSFYVLDFVEGVRLDAQLTAGECDVREALRLMALICEAIDYAHQRGVLHRDLKPSNILVDQRGDPHILDFGLAKAIDPGSQRGVDRTLSTPGQILGTLGYMSPEQSRGMYDQMSVRSDVYSLGAMLYELLTGELPCSTIGPLSDVLQGIAERDPPRASSIRRGLGADIDAILFKALEKAPHRRYATAGELAAEIHRILNNEPIVARTPSAAIRVSKWVRRHKAVSAVSTVAFVLLVAITAASFVRIIKSRDDARAALAMYTDGLMSLDVQRALGPNASMSTVVDRFAQSLGTRLADQPEAQATLRTTLGETYLGWEEYDKAEEQFKLALDLREQVFGPRHVAVAEALHNLARPMFYLRRYEQARDLYQQALDMRIALLGANDKDTGETMHHLASTYREMKQYDRAEALYRKALAIRLKHPEDVLSLEATRNNLGLLLLKVGRLTEAEPLFREALASVQRLPEAERKPLFEALTMQNLAECLFNEHKYDDAAHFFEDALNLKLQLTGADSLTVAQTLHGFGELRLAQGRLDDADNFAQRALAIRSAKHDPQADATQELIGRIADARAHPAPN